MQKKDAALISKVEEVVARVHAAPPYPEEVKRGGHEGVKVALELAPRHARLKRLRRHPVRAARVDGQPVYGEAEEVPVAAGRHLGLLHLDRAEADAANERLGLTGGRRGQGDVQREQGLLAVAIRPPDLNAGRGAQLERDGHFAPRERDAHARAGAGKARDARRQQRVAGAGRRAAAAEEARRDAHCATAAAVVGSRVDDNVAQHG